MTGGAKQQLDGPRYYSLAPSKRHAARRSSAAQSRRCRSSRIRRRRRRHGHGRRRRLATLDLTLVRQQ